MARKIIPYENAVSNGLLKEADVLLFDRQKGFPAVSWWIARATKGVYSHVGLLHWDDEEPYIVEFKEFIGSRSVHLKSQIDCDSGCIDVYSPLQRADIPKHLDGYNREVQFSQESIAQKITDEALKLTGESYGWDVILEILKSYTPLLRLRKVDLSDKRCTTSFVCSTLVTYTYRKFYLDPIPHMPDILVTPNALARSALFKYQFTLKCGKE